MKLAYITAQLPWGHGERFILPEIKEIIGRGHEITIIPLRPAKTLTSDVSIENFEAISIHLPLLGIRTLALAIKELIYQPIGVTAALIKVLGTSGSLKKTIKNLAVFPKGLAIAVLARKLEVDHIHAHWASTPSTAAYIAARLLKVPWSFTAHRWDITENNMLAEKIGNAAFGRVISLAGLKEVAALVGKELASNCRLIHMGVTCKEPSAEVSIRPQWESAAAGPIDFTFACTANLLPVKGHRYLIEACRLLSARGFSFLCLFFGDGPLMRELRNQIEQACLEKTCLLLGRRTHEELLALFWSAKIDAVILPSIITDAGDKEGVPVALMEAMAAGVPVVATATGAIPELLFENTGILVPQKDPKALADALESLMTNEQMRKTLAQNGRARVKQEFAIEAVVNDLLAQIIEPRPIYP